MGRCGTTDGKIRSSFPAEQAVSMKTESLFFGHAVSLGVLMASVYDGCRIFRRVIPHNAFWTALEDLLFWIFCGAKVFELMYRMSNGTLRWFAVLGGLGGILLYHRLVSPWMVKGLSAWLLKTKHVLIRWTRRIFQPFRKAAGKVKQAGKSAAGRYRGWRKQVSASAKKRLTSLCKVLKMIMTRK